MTGLVLASASPRRRDLLQQMGLSDVIIDPADADETVLPAELPRIYAARVATLKAEAKRALHTGKFLLAADTVVAVGRRILPKTENEGEARRCLSLLSGRSHRVYGAITLIRPDGQLRERLVETRVTVKRLHPAEINSYIAGGEWRGKAGGYAIQGAFAAHIPSIQGSYSNVVGLSLYDTRALLVGNGFER